MILQSLRHHWPARKIEWIMAGLTASWGFYILTHPEIFTDERTRHVWAGLSAVSSPATSDPASFWGWTALVIGLSRALALFINGAYVRTPIVRLGAAFVSMFIFTQISLGLWQSGVPNTDLVVYPWLVIADLISAYRASQDAVYAENHRLIQKGFSRGRYSPQPVV